MTDVNVDLKNVAGFRGDGQIGIAAQAARPAASGTEFVTGEWHFFKVVDGRAVMTDLDPGPAEIIASMGGWEESWKVMVPDEEEPITFATLLDAYVEYDSAVVGQAQSARDTAIAAAGDAGDARDAAQGFAADAAATYAALTDDIENAADAVRAQVEADADRAENSADAADGSASAAALSSSAAGAARNTAVTKAGEATAAASSSSASAGTASTDADRAEVARTAAESASDIALTKADEATAAASSAAGHAGDAQSARIGAESARSDANYARSQAVSAREAADTARDTAVTKAGEAAQSASDASAAKSAAQAAASSFGLSAGTVTTGSSESSAAVTVTGSGPSYTLNFSIPRGKQGGQGPKGDGLKVDFTPATYSMLPTGLNGTTDVGKVAWVASNNRLYVWSGTAWPAEADGLILAGAKGDPGKSAYQVAVEDGFAGTATQWLETLVGDPGDPGDDGDSAYELAVAAGFSGTEAEWLQSLHGADGVTSFEDLDDVPDTFPPTIGDTSSTAKAGSWMPEWDDVQKKPDDFPPTIGPGSTQAVAGNDPRLSNARIPTDGSVTAAKIASGTLPHDLTIVAFGDKTARAVGAGDLAGGVCMQRAMSIKSIRYRFPGADASGSTTVEVRKNGTAISGTSKTIAVADQTNTSGSAREVSGLSVSIAKGDVVTVQITAVGTTPGKALYVDIEGVTA